jgi:ankyrin repeat protein
MVNALNDYEETPLYYAISSGNVEAVKLLIEGGASTEVYNEEGITPLDKAIMLEEEFGKENSIVDFLISIGAKSVILSTKCNEEEQASLAKAPWSKKIPYEVWYPRTFFGRMLNLFSIRLPSALFN